MSIHLLPSVPTGQQGAFVGASRRSRIASSDFSRVMEKPSKDTNKCYKDRVVYLARWGSFGFVIFLFSFLVSSVGYQCFCLK